MQIIELCVELVFDISKIYPFLFERILRIQADAVFLYYYKTLFYQSSCAISYDLYSLYISDADGIQRN